MAQHLLATFRLVAAAPSLVLVTYKRLASVQQQGLAALPGLSLDRCLEGRIWATPHWLEDAQFDASAWGPECLGPKQAQYQTGSLIEIEQHGALNVVWVERYRVVAE